MPHLYKGMRVVGCWTSACPYLRLDGASRGEASQVGLKHETHLCCRPSLATCSRCSLRSRAWMLRRWWVWGPTAALSLPPWRWTMLVSMVCSSRQGPVMPTSCSDELAAGASCRWLSDNLWQPLPLGKWTPVLHVQSQNLVQAQLLKCCCLMTPGLHCRLCKLGRRTASASHASLVCSSSSCCTLIATLGNWPPRSLCFEMIA